MTSSINSILSKHGVTLSKKKPVTKKSVKPNPINVGGKQGEDLAENDIIRSGLSFRRQPKVDVPAEFFEEKARPLISQLTTMVSKSILKPNINE